MSSSITTGPEDSLERNLKNCAYEAKRRGNDAYLLGDFDTAMNQYNTAIVMYPEEAVFFSNRSAVHFARGDLHKALQDAEWAIERKYEWAKGHFRKGRALFALRQYTEASKALRTALKFDENNREIRLALDESEALLNAMNVSRDVPPPKGNIERLTWQTIKTKGAAPSCCIWNTATLVGSKIFFFGGFDGATCSDDLFVFDTCTLSWSQPTTNGKPPAAYYFHTAAAIGTKIFYFGGIGHDSLRHHDLHSHLLVLDTETMSWSQPGYCGMAPVYRLSHTACTVGNSMYVFGGWDGHATNYNHLFVFNTDTITWREPITRGQPPPKRYAHTCSVCAGKLYVIGGTDKAEIEDGSHVFTDVHVLDLDTFTWSKLDTTGPYPSNPIWHSVNVVGSNLFLFGGGNYTSKKKSLGVSVLDVDTLRWSTPRILGDAPIKRFGHTSTRLASRIWLTGGMGAFRGHQKIFTNEMWVLDIAGYSLRELRHDHATGPPMPAPAPLHTHRAVAPLASSALTAPLSQPPPPSDAASAAACSSPAGAAAGDVDGGWEEMSFEEMLAEEKQFQAQLKAKAAQHHTTHHSNNTHPTQPPPATHNFHQNHSPSPPSPSSSVPSSSPSVSQDASFASGSGGGAAGGGRLSKSQKRRLNQKNKHHHIPRAPSPAPAPHSSPSDARTTPSSDSARCSAACAAGAVAASAPPRAPCPELASLCRVPPAAACHPPHMPVSPDTARDQAPAAPDHLLPSSHVHPTPLPPSFTAPCASKVAPISSTNSSKTSCRSNAPAAPQTRSTRLS